MRLIDNCLRDPGMNKIEKVDKVFESVGLSQKNAFEFSSLNISDFNKVAEDVHGVDYYSIGAQRRQY